MFIIQLKSLYLINNFKKSEWRYIPVHSRNKFSTNKNYSALKQRPEENIAACVMKYMSN